jgi:hypothetical protein
VVVWPGNDMPGWINLHTHAKNNETTKNNGKPFVVGWPFKTVGDLISRAHWLQHTNGQFFDAWYCTSQQSEHAVAKTGKPKAIRLHKNATWLKAIWVDVDVGNKLDPVTGKPETKHYDTAAEAWAAVSAFRKVVGLPSPSAVVNSGGGLHIYWINSSPLTPADWRPYAEGLKALLLREGVKCDAGLTTDDVRILRVPGTFNHKYDPPKPVVLLQYNKLYNFEADLLFLKYFKVSPVAVQNSPPIDQKAVMYGSGHTDKPADIDPAFDLSGPDAAFAGLDPLQALGAGIVRAGPSLVDPAPVFAQCEFLGHAKATGGIDYDNPLWNLSVLCTAFMENGNVLAHEVSRSHSTYFAPDTQTLYDRKVADRADRGIGYPSCAAIAGAGCKSCAACTLFAKGQSPLNIRPAFTAAVTTPIVQSAAAIALQLPDGYELDQDGIINAIETKFVKGDEVTTWYPLFHCKIDDAYVTKDPDGLHLHVSTDKGNWRTSSFKPRDLVGQGVDKVMVEQGVIIRAENTQKLGTFLMSFISKMHKAAQSQTTIGFGWHRTAGAVDGFAYGARLYKDDGTDTPAGMVDRQLQQRFSPTGDMAHWYDAWSYIQMQKRPDLEVVVAAAFASPLIMMTGETGMLLSCAGEKGAGKTYVMELGCAVWGHPKETKETKQSTEKSVINRMGMTNSLPAYWDEVSDDIVQGKVLNLMDASTAGVEGSRLFSDIKQQGRGTWNTAVVINANRRFKEFLVKKQRDHGAGLNRVFEFWVVRNPPNPVGQISDTSIPARALSKLQYNYGGVGLEYAKFIAANHEAIQTKMVKKLAEISALLQRDKEDRMWLALVASILTGAELANLMPTPVGFDVPAIYDFLVKAYKDNVDQRRNANIDPGQADYGGDYLAQYLKDHLMDTIWTKARSAQPPGRGGRPARVEFYRLMPGVATHHGVQVRWDKQDDTLRFSARNFEDWCDRSEGRVYTAIKDSLERNFGMVKEKRSLCAGCAGFEVNQEWVFTICVSAYPDLKAALNSNEPAVDNSELGTPVGVVTAEQIAAAAGNITLAENLIK